MSEVRRFESLERTVAETKRQLEERTNTLFSRLGTHQHDNIVGGGSFATVATTGSYNDLVDKPTIPAGYTDEQARDAVGAALVAGANVTITPNDAADTITISAAGSAGPQVAWKDVGQAYSSIGFAPDNDLRVTLAASSRYLLEGWLTYYILAGTSLQLLWSYPTGTTMTWAAPGLAAGETTTFGDMTGTIDAGSVPATGIRSVGGVGAAASTTYPATSVSGFVRTAGSGGTLALNFGGSGTSPYVELRKDSWLKLTKVA